MRAPHLFALVAALVSCGPDIGDECDVAADCDGIAGGYCARVGVCTAPCSHAGAVCADEDATCASIEDRLVCLPNCESTEDCEVGACTRVASGARVCIVDPLDPG